jgi:hypothetical protein
MALVHLAFLAQAAVVPALADASEGAAQRLQEPLAARIAYLVQAGELPAHVDAGQEAARLRGCYSTGCACSSSPLLVRPQPGGRRRSLMTTSPRWPPRPPRTFAEFSKGGHHHDHNRCRHLDLPQRRCTMEE